MHVSFRAVALSVVVAFSGFLFTPMAMPQVEASETCPEFERSAFLTKKPLLVNPGGKCYWRFTFETPLNSASDKPPRLCLFARVAGSDTEYGPSCTDGENFGMNVPAQI